MKNLILLKLINILWDLIPGVNENYSIIQIIIIIILILLMIFVGVNFPLLQDGQPVNVGIIFSDTTIEKNQVNPEIISSQVSKE